jgi:hypothetical protein
MRRWWWLVPLAAAATVTRALQARGALLYPDGYDYLLMAKGIAAHGRPIVTLGAGGDTWIPSADASVKPLFPALVALVHLLGVPLRAAAEGITVAAGAAICVLAGALSARLTASTAVGAAAGALCIASPTLGHWIAFSGPDPLAQALALGAALALLNRRPGLAGALAGLCIATRPEYALLAVPVCAFSLRFATVACATVAAVLFAVRPPIALNTAAASIAGAAPSGLTGVLRSDWPLFALAALGLAYAPRRHAVVLVGAASALGLAYLLKDPGSARYFSTLVPVAIIAAAYAFARRPGALLAAGAVALMLAMPRPAGPSPDGLRQVAKRLAGTEPVYTAAPDAYGLMLSRPVRFLRPGVHGLILVDGAQRTYAPEITVRGRVVRRLPKAAPFVRPNGTLDDEPITIVRGIASERSFAIRDRREERVGARGRIEPRML